MIWQTATLLAKASLRLSVVSFHPYIGHERELCPLSTFLSYGFSPLATDQYFIFHWRPLWHYCLWTITKVCINEGSLRAKPSLYVRHKRNNYRGRMTISFPRLSALSEYTPITQSIHQTEANLKVLPERLYAQVIVHIQKSCCCHLVAKTQYTIVKQDSYLTLTENNYRSRNKNILIWSEVCCSPPANEIANTDFLPDSNAYLGITHCAIYRYTRQCISLKTLQYC
jgi:hypothetical protein